MPLVKQKYRICKECGCIGGIFYAQKRIDRPTKLNIHSICILCKREKNKDSFHKLYPLDPKRYYERTKKYIAANRNLVNKKRREKRKKNKYCGLENFYLLETL